MNSKRHIVGIQFTIIFMLFVVLLLFNSCAIPNRIIYPDLNIFGKSTISYVSEGSIECNKRNILKIFLEKNLLSYQDISNDNINIITNFVYEEPTINLRTYLRFAYKITLTNSELSSNCTDISLTWVIQSRGKREEIWTTTDLYKPSNLDEVKNFLKRTSCI